jgi:Icc-related predicted phosphoesterase
MYVEGIKIDCISDTHNRHKHFTLPGGDILLHAGDATGQGRFQEIIPFLDWFADQDYSHLVLIPGNHDFGFEQDPSLYADECKKRNIVLLNDSGYDADGIKVWGSPITPWFHDWAFNRERGDEIRPHWDLIPDDTEILVTHGPPMLIRDWVRPGTPWEDHVGCWDLGHVIDTRLKKLKLHVFGHIHEARGYTYKNGKTYINASALDGMYCPVKGVPIRVVKDIVGDYFIEDRMENESLD